MTSLEKHELFCFELWQTEARRKKSVHWNEPIKRKTSREWWKGIRFWKRVALRKRFLKRKKDLKYKFSKTQSVEKVRNRIKEGKISTEEVWKNLQWRNVGENWLVTETGALLPEYAKSNDCFHMTLKNFQFTAMIGYGVM